MKIKNIIFIAVLIIGGVSCTSIEVDPIENDLFQPDFSDVSDLEAVLNSVYSGLKAEGAYTGLLMAEGEWPADNLKLASTNTGQGAIDHEWDYEEGSQNFEDIWTALYRVIRRANFVIQNSDVIDGNDQVRAQELKAEALTIRALCHYELAKTFGADYNTGDELAVPFITDPEDIFQEQARISYNNLFALLRMDINQAINLLSTDFNPNRASVALAHGINARIYLLESDYTNAILSASMAIDNAPQLSTISDYPLMFGENDEDGESIFKLALNPDDNKINDPYFIEGVGARFDPTSDLLSLYTSNDIRYDVNFQPINGILSIFKYRGASSNRDLHEPFIMRTSEMYLIRAESNASLNNDDLARNDLDLLRSNRISGYTSQGEMGDALDEAIRVERRIELAYEGFRFFDLRRWGLDVVRNDCTSDECVLLRSSDRFVFPIPRAELFSNDNMEQNSGY